MTPNTPIAVETDNHPHDVGAAPAVINGVPFAPGVIAALCRRRFITRLMLYGSILRDDFHAGSDVDVLVEFEPGKTPGFEFIGIQDELSALLGREVDLGTPEGLSKYIKDRVMGEALVIYVRG